MVIQRETLTKHIKREHSKLHYSIVIRGTTNRNRGSLRHFWAFPLPCHPWRYRRKLWLTASLPHLASSHRTNSHECVDRRRRRVKVDRFWESCPDGEGLQSLRCWVGSRLGKCNQSSRLQIFSSESHGLETCALKAIISFPATSCKPGTKLCL